MVYLYVHLFAIILLKIYSVLELISICYAQNLETLSHSLRYFFSLVDCFSAQSRIYIRSNMCTHARTHTQINIMFFLQYWVLYPVFLIFSPFQNLLKFIIYIFPGVLATIIRNNGVVWICYISPKTGSFQSNLISRPIWFYICGGLMGMVTTNS